jgi:hypothetical protein
LPSRILRGRIFDFQHRLFSFSFSFQFYSGLITRVSVGWMWPTPPESPVRMWWKSLPALTSSWVCSPGAYWRYTTEDAQSTAESCKAKLNLGFVFTSCKPSNKLVTDHNSHRKKRLEYLIQERFVSIKNMWLGVVVHTCNPGTREIEVGL